MQAVGAQRECVLAAEAPGAEASAALAVGSSAASSSSDRKRLTREGASDLLDALEAAYRDPWFTKRVDKLAWDVGQSTQSKNGCL